MITGANLATASSVLIGGVAASYTISSATRIVAVVGTGATGAVQVTTPGGTATGPGSFAFYKATSSLLYGQAEVLSIGANSSPGTVAIGDLNEDGLPDLVVNSYGGGGVAIAYAEPDGGFQNPTLVSIGRSPQSVIVAQLSPATDQHLDIATSNTDGTVSILLGYGDGGFAAQPDGGYPAIGVGNDPEFVVTADVNLDGAPDLITSNADDNTVSVVLGIGNGQFLSQSQAYSTGSGSDPNGLAVGDVDNDGIPDVVTADQATAVHAISVLLGDGTGRLTEVASFTAGSGPRKVVLADLNGDGNLDAVVSDSGGSEVSVLLGSGDAGFQAEFPVVNCAGCAEEPFGLAVADVNGIGRPDVVFTNYTSPGSLVVSESLSDGGFEADTPFDLSVGTYPDDVAVSDLNGDGYPDLVCVNNGSGTISVFLRQ